MYFIGYDLGSSSIKAALVDENNNVIASTSYPDIELSINSPNPGWAEQNPDSWRDCTVQVTKKLLQKANVSGQEVISIGIGYQMHGLVILDEKLNVLRPSIIWCDSRAVETGKEILESVGIEKCQQHLLNTPSNFTFSKLRWVQVNESDLFKKIRWVVLPGDYLALKMTGKVFTTISGLSEGTLWDFKNNEPATFLLDHYYIPKEIIPEALPTFGDQGQLTPEAAIELGISAKARVGYRAGDQPNNALALSVLEPVEVAATGGTSGAVYGVQDQNVFDPGSRVNSFAHVNHSKDQIRTGVLLCINGSGIQYRWAKSMTASQSYENMEKVLSEIPIGSDGISILPFGNGAERMLENQNIGGQLSGLDFNRHTPAHFYRASLEGIANAFQYGIEILNELGIPTLKLRVGNDNLFRSATFSQTVSNLCKAPIEVVKTTGAIGAARGSAFGNGHFNSLKEAVGSDPIIKTYEPKHAEFEATEQTYQNWKYYLNKLLKK